MKDPVVRVPGLRDWESVLLKDCEPASRLGNIRPIMFMPKAKAERGSELQDIAIAHATLGFKALHSFWYDMCKYQFEQAIESDPRFEASYWGRALCDSQLLWGSENITSSTSYLRAAPRRRRRNRLNELYLSAVKGSMSNEQVAMYVNSTKLREQLLTCILT